MFESGKEQGISDVLAHKEQRLMFQEKLLSQFVGKSLVTLTLNIPGPIKSNADLIHLFDMGRAEINQLIQALSWRVIYEKALYLDSGNDGFWIIDESPKLIKEQLINIEEKIAIARLFDMDVSFEVEGKLIQISRKELNKQPRRCLLCQTEAKICARSRKHSVAELQYEIERLFREEKQK